MSFIQTDGVKCCDWCGAVVYDPDGGEIYTCPYRELVNTIDRAWDRASEWEKEPALYEMPFHEYIRSILKGINDAK